MKLSHRSLVNFIRQSNEIEGIYREPTPIEISFSKSFLEMKKIGISDLSALVKAYQPEAMLRDKEGLNVRIGRYYPTRGGPHIRGKLQDILDNMEVNGSYITHLNYEALHPFTDGNGRSGRMLWAWGMGVKMNFDRSFLQEFYYQTLNEYTNG